MSAFFVTDCIWENEMKIEYCPTEMTIVDFYTKPLQGKQFRLFQKMILNLNDEDVQNIICAEKLSILEDYNKNNYRDKND